jgi:hypothetical protein
MVAYFDTQAFDYIYKKIGCTSADIANLRKAIYSRQLSIRLSVHTLEEILLGRKASPQAFAAQIKLTLSLASSRTLVKGCAQLVLDDIRAYAARGEPERPFLAGDLQNVVAEGISTLIESDGEELEDDFLAVLDQARQEKRRFFAMLEDTRQVVETITRPPGGWATFEQHFDAAALPMVERLAEQAGVTDRCRARGLNGLLEMKSVRTILCAVLATSLGQPAGATTIALHHAVSAATVAQTYVTDSGPDRDFATRLPIAGWNVVSLPDFLKQL